MTTYTAISGTETQSGKPITESLMTRLANNLVAVTEGDPTAPPINPYALDAGAITISDHVEATGEITHTFNHGYTASKNCIVFVKMQGSLTDVRLRVDGTDIKLYGNGDVDKNHMISFPSGDSTVRLIRDSGTISYASLTFLVIS